MEIKEIDVIFGIDKLLPMVTIQLFWFSVKFALKILKNKQTRFEFKDFDSGNAIHFSYFTPQFSHLARKSGYLNKHKKETFFLNRETKLILLLSLEMILIGMCHVLREQFYCCCM